MQSAPKLALFFVACTLAVCAVAGDLPDYSFDGITPSKTGFDIRFSWNGKRQSVLHDDDGVATLAVLQRMYADAWENATPEERKAWKTEVPGSPQTKGLILDALGKAIASMQAEGPRPLPFPGNGLLQRRARAEWEQREAQIAAYQRSYQPLVEAQARLKGAKDPGFGSDDVINLGAWLDRVAPNREYASTYIVDGESIPMKQTRLAFPANQRTDETKLFVKGIFADRSPLFSAVETPKGSRNRIIFASDLKTVGRKYAEAKGAVAPSGVPDRMPAREPLPKGPEKPSH